MFHHSGVEGRPRNESRRDGIFIDRDLQNVSKVCRSEMVLVAGIFYGTRCRS
jgi:hypothetical protein